MRQCFFVCSFSLFFCLFVFSVFSVYFLVLFHRGMHLRKVLFFDVINVQKIKDQMFQIGFSPRRMAGHH